MSTVVSCFQGTRVKLAQSRDEGVAAAMWLKAADNHEMPAGDQSQAGTEAEGGHCRSSLRQALPCEYCLTLHGHAETEASTCRQ